MKIFLRVSMGETITRVELAEVDVDPGGTPYTGRSLSRSYRDTLTFYRLTYGHVSVCGHLAEHMN